MKTQSCQIQSPAQLTPFLSFPRILYSHACSQCHVCLLTGQPHLDLAKALKVLPELDIADHGGDARHEDARGARRRASSSRQGILCLQRREKVLYTTQRG